MTLRFAFRRARSRPRRPSLPNALSRRGHSAATSTAMAATKSAIQTTLTTPILSTGARPFVSVSHPKRGVYKQCCSVQARGRAGLDGSSVPRALGNADERAVRQGEVAAAVLCPLWSSALGGRPLLLRVRPALARR